MLSTRGAKVNTGKKFLTGALSCLSLSLSLFVLCYCVIVDDSFVVKSGNVSAICLMMVAGVTQMFLFGVSSLNFDGVTGFEHYTWKVKLKKISSSKR